MWAVFKYKKNESEILKNSITSILGDKPEFYHPKVKIKKIIKGKIKDYKKNLLDKYFLCRHSKFSDPKIMNLMNYAKGNQLILSGHNENQKNLINFIENCKSHENEDGFLKQSFFNNSIGNKIQFHSGILSQLIFEVIEDKKRELKVLSNKIKFKISKDQQNLLFKYV